MKLIIDERIWLHGEGGMASSLYRSRDGKLCCLGIYGLACGISKEAMQDVATLGELHLLNRSTPVPEWLVKGNEYANCIENTSAATQLMRANDDDELITDAERKDRITEIFGAHGVEVEFINGDVLQEAKGVLDEATKHHLDQAEIGTVQAQVC